MANRVTTAWHRHRETNCLAGCAGRLGNLFLAIQRDDANRGVIGFAAHSTLLQHTGIEIGHQKQAAIETWGPARSTRFAKCP